MAVDAGTRCARIIARARPLKRSVLITTAGRPRAINCAVPWTLHDVHEPQLAMPTMAASASRAMRSGNSAGIADDAENG
jgi:hypothetical protein